MAPSPVTLIACCFALIPLVGVPADLHGTLALSDTSRVSSYPSLLGDETYVDLGTFPRAELTFPSRRSVFSVGYGPQLTLHDVTRSDVTLLLLHTGHASYSYSWLRSSVYLSQSAAYGTQNFSTLGFLGAGASVAPQPTAMPAPAAMPPQTAQPQFLPQQPTLQYFAESTSAGFSTDFSHRETLGSYIAYGISGGFGDEAQKSLPQQRSESLGVFFLDKVSRRDSMTTTASLSHSIVDPAGLQYWYLSANEVWRHDITRSLSGALGAGVAQTWSRTDRGWSPSTSPTATASLTGALFSYRRRRFSVSVSFALSLSPVINAVTGAIQQTLGGSTNVVVRKDRTTVTGTISAAQTFPSDDPASARFIGAGVVATQQLSDLVDLFGGYFSAIQVSNSAQLSLSRQWNAFFGISLHPPAIRF